MASQDPEERSSALKAYVNALNKQFTDWVLDQKANNLDVFWTDGVKDYLEHVDFIMSEFQDVINAKRRKPSGRDKGPNGNETSTGFSFGAPKTTPPASGFSFGAAGGSSSPAPFKLSPSEPANKPSEGTGPSTASFFSFGKPADAGSKPADAGASAAGTATTTSSSFFGSGSSTFGSTGAAVAPASSTGTFMFGNAAASSSAASAPSSAPNFFGMGGNGSAAAANPFTFGTAAAPAAAGQGQAEEEAEEPQKYESEIATSEEAGAIAFKTKAKFSHYKKDDAGNGNWDSKGVGLLIVRTRPTDPTKPFVTFTTEAGRVLYIANIYKAMKLVLSETEKQSSLSFSAPWSPEPNGQPSLQMVRFTVPKGKNAEFQSVVEGFQAGM